MQPLQILKYSQPFFLRSWVSVTHLNSRILSPNVARLSTNVPQELSIHNNFHSQPNYVNNNQCKKLLNVSKDVGSLLFSRGYAMRLELTEYGILWRRPEYVPVWKPEKSGDLIEYEEADKKLPVLSMLHVANEIAKTDEKTQRLLSLEFANTFEVRKMVKYKLKRKIQRHQFDDNSPEVKIAMMTVDIRYLQKYVAANKKKVRIRVRLQETIDKRRKRLRRLRKVDYKKFEWLLEELGIIYRPAPKYLKKITRKESLRKLVRMHCIKIRKDKMEAYRLHLKTLQKPFLEEKQQTLQWIAEMEKKLGLPVSVEVPEDLKTKEKEQIQVPLLGSSDSEPENKQL